MDQLVLPLWIGNLKNTRLSTLTFSLTDALTFLFLFPLAFCWLSLLASLLFSAFSLLPRSALCFFVSSLSFFSFSTSVMRIFFWVRVSSFAGFDALEFRVEYTTVARPPDYSTVTGPHSRLPPAGLPEICDGCVFFTSPAAGRSSVLSGSVGVDSPSVACCSPCWVQRKHINKAHLNPCL